MVDTEAEAAEAVSTETGTSRARCIKQRVQIAATSARYRSNPHRADRSIAKNATQSTLLPERTGADTDLASETSFVL